MATEKITLDELRSLVKEIINEGLPIGKSEMGQQYAYTLNQIIGKIENPILNKKARFHASEIIRLIDEDQDQ